MGKIYGIDEYVSTKRSIATKKASEKAIRHFLEYTYPDAEITPKTINQVSLDHISNTADHAETLREYCLFLVREHYAPNSINQKIMYVQHWYKWNGIIISPAEAGIIQNIMPRICTVHEDHPLTRQEIQSILSHADPLMRALILLLASSGMRIGEALSICPDDIRLGEPSAVHLSRDRMKARTAHTYYFSSEAQAAISEWLKVRDAYLTTAGVRTRLCLKHKTSRSSCIFPLSAATIREKFVRILKAAKLYELCEESGRATITLHSFRKWSESTMKLHIPINVANELIGHDEGLSKSYRRYSDQQIKAAYLSVEPHLSVLAPPDYSELREHTASVLAEQQATTSAIAAELVKMKAELDEIRMFMHTSE